MQIDIPLRAQHQSQRKDVASRAYEATGSFQPSKLRMIQTLPRIQPQPLPRTNATDVGWLDARHVHTAIH